MTALMRAAKNNAVNVIPLLIEKEMKMADNNGRTALVHAINNGCLEAVLLLKAEKGILNDEGLSPLQIAEKKGNKEIVAALK